jgi:hypothetical protein
MLPCVSKKTKKKIRGLLDGARDARKMTFKRIFDRP